MKTEVKYVDLAAAMDMNMCLLIIGGIRTSAYDRAALSICP